MSNSEALRLDIRVTNLALNAIEDIAGDQHEQFVQEAVLGIKDDQNLQEIAAKMDVEAQRKATFSKVLTVTFDGEARDILLAMSTEPIVQQAMARFAIAKSIAEHANQAQPLHDAEAVMRSQRLVAVHQFTRRRRRG